MAIRNLFEQPDFGIATIMFVQLSRIYSFNRYLLSFSSNLLGWFMPSDTSGLPGGLSLYLRKRRRFYTDGFSFWYLLDVWYASSILEQWEATLSALRKTATIYVGNMTFQTTEEQVQL